MPAPAATRLRYRSSAGHYDHPKMDRFKEQAERSQQERRAPSDPSVPSGLGILGFGTSLALVAYILSGISLGHTLALVVAGAAVLGRYVWTHSSPSQKLAASRGLKAGAVAGVTALAAYDSSRWALVELLSFTFRPFEAFGAFGRGLWGARASGWWVEATGFGLHVTNGIGFAVGYTLLAGRRGPLAGVVFALGLEAAMVALYPSWLRIGAIDEFLQVSMLGHVAYGATLGWVARWLLGRWSPATAA